MEFKHAFFAKLIPKFFGALDFIATNESTDDARAYCERFVEFIVDLLV